MYSSSSILKYPATTSSSCLARSASSMNLTVPLCPRSPTLAFAAALNGLEGGRAVDRLFSVAESVTVDPFVSLSRAGVPLASGGFFGHSVYRG